MASPLKENVGPEAIARLAAAFAAASPAFPAGEFERDCRRGLAELELKARFARVADVLGRHLPDDFEAAAAVVERAIADPALGLWDLWGVTVWIGDAGADAREVSRAAELLAGVTQRASGEFGVRPLIDADPELMRSIIWAGRARPTSTGGASHRRDRDRCCHGLRALRSRARTMGWGLALLEPLTADPSEYVRRSVANHLNDISKLDPELSLATAERWLHGAAEPTEKLVAHAMRTLVRAGDPRALALVGVDAGAKVEVEHLAVEPFEVAAQRGWSAGIPSGR